jgi:hypothetical protein
LDKSPTSEPAVAANILLSGFIRAEKILAIDFEKESLQ